MTDAVADSPTPPAKSKIAPLIIGLVLALCGAGGGFYAVSLGLIPIGGAAGHNAAADPSGPLDDVAFVELDPIMISMNGEGGARYLRFRAQLEVTASHRQDVELLVPRVIDVLNGYLRALEMRDLEDPLALTRLRSQMLRRIQVVAGKDRVRDVLIMDFVLN